MEYKILIIKNRYKKKPNFKTGLDWFAEHTPLKIVVDELETDYDFTYKEVGNGTFKGTVPKDYSKLTSVVPRSKYHAVVLLLGNDVPGVRVSITEEIPLYPDTEFIYLAKETDKGKTLNHELFHCFFKVLSRKGIYLQDPMDTYLRDNELAIDNGTTNRTMALDLLKPYWERICKPVTIIDKVVATVKPSVKPLTQVTYSEEFKNAVEVILMHEGGYANNPKDPGGETNFGISKRAYPKEDIKNLTKERAIEIYYKDYWLPSSCDKMPYKIALNVFDMSVNAGVLKSIKLLQTALGVKADGIIGKVTLGALANSKDIVYLFAAERIKYYSNTGGWSTFKNVWINRTLKTLSYD